MSQPQSSIQIGFQRPWQIRRPLVYRYLDRQWVDAFFETGTLRLSSFATFSQHGDEQRKDEHEGSGVVVHENPDKKNPFTIFSKISQGQNSYVLCGSTRFDPEIGKAFNADSGFRINDPTAFANAISSHIPGFRAGMEGLCNYRGRKAVDRAIQNYQLEDFENPDGQTIDMEKAMQAVFGVAGDELFFLKLTQYAIQSEYRFLWFTHQKGHDSKVIECPEALQFCTRFEDLWTEQIPKEA